jgi:hypothetical protein
VKSIMLEQSKAPVSECPAQKLRFEFIFCGNVDELSIKATKNHVGIFTW